MNVNRAIKVESIKTAAITICIVSTLTIASTGKHYEYIVLMASGRQSPAVSQWEITTAEVINVKQHKLIKHYQHSHAMEIGRNRIRDFNLEIHSWLLLKVKCIRGLVKFTNKCHPSACSVVGYASRY